MDRSQTGAGCIPFYNEKGDWNKMTWFTKWAFRNKASLYLMVLIVLVVGVASFFKLPYEFLPNANQPFITVTTLGQGYDAGSMANQVTTPLEKEFANLKGKTSMTST